MSKNNDVIVRPANGNKTIDALNQLTTLFADKLEENHTCKLKRITIIRNNRIIVGECVLESRVRDAFEVVD